MFQSSNWPYSSNLSECPETPSPTQGPISVMAKVAPGRLQVLSSVVSPESYSHETQSLNSCQMTLTSNHFATKTEAYEDKAATFGKSSACSFLGLSPCYLTPSEMTACSISGAIFRHSPEVNFSDRQYTVMHDTAYNLDARVFMRCMVLGSNCWIRFQTSNTDTKFLVVKPERTKSYKSTHCCDIEITYSNYLK